MKQRLLASDYRFLAVCAVLLAATTWYSARNFHRAFPEASIDFRVNRAEGESLATQFLARQGFRIEGYRRASSFTFDDDAKTFLERTAGLETANVLMGSRIRLWRWAYRWFRPLQKEEFRVEITVSGGLAGFQHEIAEDAARPGISQPDARARAEAFLRSTLQRDPATLDFVEAAEVARPHRTDRTFTWKERDFNLADATYRLEVTLHGDEVAGYREYLKIPEQWTRDYQRLRSKNEAASTVDVGFFLALGVGLVIVIVMRVRRQDIHWRRAATVGVIAMALSFLSHLNEMPLHQFDYPTTDSYASFMMRELLSGIVGALGSGGLLFVVVAGAEALYRETFPEQFSLGSLFTVRGLRTKRFFLGAVLGITLTGIFIAYQTVFYITATRFGAWSPADVPYSDLLNTRFPWLFVLFGGFFPAAFEEFTFRMFAIPFLRKVARSMAIAVVLAGFIWGFGHANYPQQPFFIRGVEVGIGGVALGLVMLRWGILPTLVWHYSVDAMYSAMLLLRSQSLYFKLSGAASAGIIVLPVVAALIAYWRNGGFEPETGLLNADEARPADEPPPQPLAEPEATADKWESLPIRRRWAAAVLFALGVVAMAIPVSRFGAAPQYKLSADQALASSDAFLRSQGMDPAAFLHVVAPSTHWGGDDSLAGKYFLERLPLDKASALFERYRPFQHWAIRYFKSLDQEEALVSVHPETGRVLGWRHTLPEDRPGADIPDDAARDIAAAFASSLGWDTAAMDLKESTSEKKKARRDHALVWEARPGDPRNLDEARMRVQVNVAGDRASSLRAFWKLPEDFQRARERQNFLSILSMVLRFGVLAAGIVAAIFLLVQQIRRGLVPWKTTLKLAIPAAILTVVGPLLSMQLFLQNYSTAMALELYRAMTYIVVAMSSLFAFVLMGAAAALIAAFFPDSLAAFRRAGRRALGRDAAYALLAATGLALLLRQAGLLLLARFHGSALFSIDSPDIIVSALPSLAVLSGAFRSILFAGAALALVALVVARLPRPWMLVPLGLLLASISLPGDIRTPGEFVLQFGLGCLTVAVAMAFCFWFARRNYLAYALALLVFAIRGPLSDLYGNAIPGLSVQGGIVAAVLGAVILWAIVPAYRRV
jgi:membrane protease YdiL (CAAX protease family)